MTTSTQPALHCKSMCEYLCSTMDLIFSLLFSSCLFDFDRLESILVQHEVAECIIEWRNESDFSLVTTLPTSVVALDRDIHSLLRRQNICIADHSSLGLGSAPATELIAAELQNLTTLPSSISDDITSSALQALADKFHNLHASTLLAGYAVLSYLQWWKQQCRHKTIDISTGLYGL